MKQEIKLSEKTKQEEAEETRQEEPEETRQSLQEVVDGPKTS